jgi:hypothetical protein
MGFIEDETGAPVLSGISLEIGASEQHSHGVIARNDEFGPEDL